MDEVLNKGCVVNYLATLTDCGVRYEGPAKRGQVSGKRTIKLLPQCYQGVANLAVSYSRTFGFVSGLVFALKIGVHFLMVTLL